MGLTISRIFSSFWGKIDARIVMIGLDAAGKTTILYRLKLGEVISTIPTIGFSVETIEYKNTSLTVWDVGGQNKIRPLWRHYYLNTQAVIFVVDAADKERIDPKDKKGADSAREELARVLAHDELKDAILLVFANKQDQDGAMKPSELASALGLTSLRNRQWHVQGCCAHTGDGLYEGLDWVADTLTKRGRQ